MFHLSVAACDLSSCFPRHENMCFMLPVASCRAASVSFPSACRLVSGLLVWLICVACRQGKGAGCLHTRDCAQCREAAPGVTFHLLHNAASGVCPLCFCAALSTVRPHDNRLAAMNCAHSHCGLPASYCLLRSACALVKDTGANIDI
jgi:hypothetical protein